MVAEGAGWGKEMWRVRPRRLAYLLDEIKVNGLKIRVVAQFEIKLSTTKIRVKGTSKAAGEGARPTFFC
jgi:hypothetical protein